MFQTDGFPSFFCFQCSCHSTACAWAAEAGQQLSRWTCFQNLVLNRGWCVSPRQEIPSWLCVFSVAHCGNNIRFRGDDASHKSKLGWWGFDQTSWRGKKGRKHRLDKYSKSSYFIIWNLKFWKIPCNLNKTRKGVSSHGEKCCENQLEYTFSWEKKTMHKRCTAG